MFPFEKYFDSHEIAFEAGRKKERELILEMLQTQPDSITFSKTYLIETIERLEDGRTID
jgi:hypothetical protein